MNFIKKCALSVLMISSITSGLYAAVATGQALDGSVAGSTTEISPFKVIGSGVSKVWSGINTFDGYYRFVMKYAPLAVIADRVLLNSACTHQYYHAAYDIPFQDMNVAPCSNVAKFGFVAACAALYKIVGTKTLDNGWNSWLCYAPWIYFADKILFDRLGQKLYQQFMYGMPKNKVQAKTNMQDVKNERIQAKDSNVRAKKVSFIPGDIAPEQILLPKDRERVEKLALSPKSQLSTEVPSYIKAFKDQVSEVMKDQEESSSSKVDYQMQTDAPSYTQQASAKLVSRGYFGRTYAGRRRKYQHKR